MVKLACALDFPRSEVYYDVIEKMNFKVTYNLRAKRVERWIHAVKRDFIDTEEIKVSFSMDFVTKDVAKKHFLRRCLKFRDIKNPKSQWQFFFCV
jgi:hypothetical protein